MHFQTSISGRPKFDQVAVSRHLRNQCLSINFILHKMLLNERIYAKYKLLKMKQRYSSHN